MLKEILRIKHEPPIASVIRPFQRFFEIDEAGGILLIASSVIALVWANSPWSEAYTTLWQTELGFSVGAFQFKHTLLHWINDALMALFFFFVGLEIKREILIGELSSMRLAALPMAAALGGMLVPALLYSLVNGGGPAAKGWGIPMATDIAFALGVLGLLGKRIPLSLTVFLAALAIADDLGAIAVIAIFYTAEISLTAIIAAAGVTLLLVIANITGARSPLLYLVLGIAAWICILNSGMHASIAGVLVAMTIPSLARLRTPQFVERSRTLIDQYEKNDATDAVTRSDDQDGVVHALEVLCENVQTPLGRMEHELYPWVSFVIIPLFALANAGIVFGNEVSSLVTSPVTLGVLLGLVVGKPVGILLFAWLAIKLNLAQLPDKVSWRHLQGVALLAGIGFTMSIFIATMAFADPTRLLHAKVGVFAASTIAAVAGWLMLRKPE